MGALVFNYWRKRFGGIRVRLDTYHVHDDHIHRNEYVLFHICNNDSCNMNLWLCRQSLWHNAHDAHGQPRLFEYRQTWKPPGGSKLVNMTSSFWLESKTELIDLESWFSQFIGLFQKVQCFDTEKYESHYFDIFTYNTVV